MITEVGFDVGSHVRQAAEKLVDAAREYGAARGVFNELEMQATAESTVETVLADWERDNAARADAYRNSPEGKKAAKDREQRRSNAQAKHDALMRSLPGLDFLNQRSVLDWLCAMQEPSDHIGVIVRKETIVAAFTRHGFRANENTGKDFRPLERDNVFRYLVGQALSGLTEGPAIHSIIHKFADEWRSKFNDGAIKFAKD